MAFKLNHVHLKSPDPKETADFYVNNLGATVVAETANGGFRLDSARSAAQRHRQD